MVLKFTIPLPPKAQKRARSRGVIIRGGGKLGQDIARSQSYTDSGQRTEQAKLMTLMYPHRPAAPLEGPLALGVRAYLPIPQSKPQKWKAAALAGEIRPTTKPDCSNMVKHLEDVMQGVFFRDDKEIVSLTIEKYYGDPARWEIVLTSPCGD